MGLARANAYASQVDARGASATALVNLATALAEGKNRFVPEVFVAGQGGSFEALGATLTRLLGDPERSPLRGLAAASTSANGASHAGSEPVPAGATAGARASAERPVRRPAAGPTLPVPKRTPPPMPAG